MLNLLIKLVLKLRLIFYDSGNLYCYEFIGWNVFSLIDLSWKSFSYFLHHFIPILKQIFILNRLFEFKAIPNLIRQLYQALFLTVNMIFIIFLLVYPYFFLLLLAKHLLSTILPFRDLYQHHIVHYLLYFPMLHIRISLLCSFYESITIICVSINEHFQSIYLFFFIYLRFVCRGHLVHRV